eukprot:6356165-Amphidinium_carterae.2
MFNLAQGHEFAVSSSDNRGSKRSSQSGLQHPTGTVTVHPTLTQVCRITLILGGSAQAMEIMVKP